MGMSIGVVYYGGSVSVHKLLYESLTPFGVLGLGSRESLEFSGHRDAYEAMDDTERLYRKIA